MPTILLDVIDTPNAIHVMRKRVRAGDAKVEGIVRGPKDARYLCITDYELARVVHVQLPWKAEESDALCASFGYIDA